MSSPTKLHNKKVSNNLIPLAGQTSKSPAMGFTSPVSITRTTRLKRKLASAFTPPAAPFNNTSFLMHLQQQREQHDPRPSPAENSRFDQYGSMHTIIARSLATPASPQNQPTVSGPLHDSQSVNERSRNAECCTQEQKGSRSPDGRICRSESDHRRRARQSSSCSDAASSGITELEIPEVETDPETREEDCESTTRHRHSQHFGSATIDTRAQGSGSGTSWQHKASIGL